MSTMVRLNEARTYTMRELNQHTARVLAEINKTGQPAAITKHGRFVALITPLEDCHIETLVLRQGPISAEVEKRATELDPVTYTSDEALQRLADYHGHEG